MTEKYYTINNTNDPDIRYEMHRGNIREVKGSGGPAINMPQMDAVAMADMEREQAVVEYNDAKRERRVFNGLISAGFLMGLGTVPTSLIVAWYVTLIMAALAFGFVLSGIGWRINDTLPEKRKRDIATRHKLSFLITEKNQKQLGA